MREFNLDVNRVAIGGVSAGGHIAAVIAHLARDAGYPLSLQVLAVPCVDLTGVFTREGKIKADCPYESYRELFDTVGLSAERMTYLHQTFLGSPRPLEYEDVSTNCYITCPSLTIDINSLALEIISDQRTEFRQSRPCLHYYCGDGYSA